MRNMDTLRYHHTLDNGEELTLSMCFTTETKNNADVDRAVFQLRCDYMYETMQRAIEEHKTKFMLKPEVGFESGTLSLRER